MIPSRLFPSWVVSPLLVLIVCTGVNASEPLEDGTTDLSYGRNAVPVSNQRAVTREEDGPKFFQRLLADPKESQSHVTVVEVDSGDTGLGTFTAGFIGVAVSYPMYRNRSDTNPSNGLQIAVESVILSQFNLDASSDDLLNTDYLVGFPLTYRDHGFSYRFRLMHQSSHLGDEFLLSGQAPQRVNLSVEFVDLILSKRLGPVRVYGGGSYAFRRSPDYLDPGEIQFGLEYRGDGGTVFTGNPVFAVNYRSLETTDWRPEVSARAGLHFPKFGATETNFHLLLEAYEGAGPFGQFFNRDVTFFGIGCYFDV